MVQAQAEQLLNQKNTGDPHPLLAASERLVGALDRLERNLQRVEVIRQRESKQQEQLAQFEQENEGLKVERSKLNAVVSQLEGQYEDLHKVAGAIYNKLDDSIKRLTQIIEA